MPKYAPPPVPDLAFGDNGPLPSHAADMLHTRILNKLAEFQIFLDVEFHNAYARTRDTTESTTICNLDEINERSPSKDAPKQSAGSPEYVIDHPKLCRDSGTNSASQDNQSSPRVPPVDEQEYQASDLQSPSIEPRSDWGDGEGKSRFSGAKISRMSSARSARSSIAVAMTDFMSATSSTKKHITRAKSNIEFDADRNNPLKMFVTSIKFDYISAVLVISNAAFIGVQVHLMYANDTALAWKIVDWVFCICFLVELALRLYVWGLRGFFIIHDPSWNRFDFFIVASSTADTILSLALGGQNSPLGSVSLLRIARIVRITRVLRIIRVMKFFKDMRVLVAAIASTLRTAFWAMALLLVCMYMFSVAIGQMVAEYISTMSAEGSPLHENDALFQFFGSIGATIFTLFMTVAGGIDWYIAAEPLYRSPPALTVYIFFITFSTFCMLNVVTGIFCQCAIETFENDKDTVMECQLAEKERFVKTLTELFAEWDSSGDGNCSKEDFERHINDENMQNLLSTLDIEARDATALYAMMDPDESGQLNLDDFINGCITLRGGAKAIHMERALVDGKMTINKLDRILRRLEDLNGNVRASFFKGNEPLQSERNVPL